MDQNRLEQILIHERKKMFKFAMSLTRNRDDAEDIVQNVYLKLWYLRENILDINPVALITLAVRREFIRILRHEKVVRDAPIVYDDLVSPNQIDSIFLNEVVEELLLLPKTQRETLIALTLQDFSQLQASKKFNVPCGTIGSRHNRARVRLREKFA